MWSRGWFGGVLGLVAGDVFQSVDAVNEGVNSDDELLFSDLRVYRGDFLLGWRGGGGGGLSVC